MSGVLNNGLYFLCAYTQQTCLQFNDANSTSALLYTYQFTGNVEQKWYIDQTSTAGFYTIQNLRYETYLTWPGGNTTGPNGKQYVIQTTTPFGWYIQQVQSDGNYIVISPEADFGATWNVMTGSKANNTPIIIWPLDMANAVFEAIPTQEDAFTSSVLPTSTAALTVTSFNFDTSITASTGTTSTATTTGTGTVISTPSAVPTSYKLTMDNKIGLGLGIGFGVPTLLLSIWGILITIRAAKGKYGKYKFRRLSTKGGDDGHELLSTFMGPELAPEPQVY